MKHSEFHTGEGLCTAAWLMLLPLFVFLLLSCPVKRALLSVSLPAVTVPHLDVVQVQSAPVASGGSQLHCCQGIIISDKTPVLQAFNLPVQPVLATLIPISIRLQHHVFQDAELAISSSQHRLFYSLRLFLKNRSFLI